MKRTVVKAVVGVFALALLYLAWPLYSAWQLRQAVKTRDMAARQALAKELNDMVTKDTMTVIPLVHRGALSAHANSLGGVKINAWDSQMWNIADWFRVK